MKKKNANQLPPMTMPMMAPSAPAFAHNGGAKEDEKKPTQVIHININQDAAVPGMAVQKTPEPDRATIRSMLQKNIDNYKAGQKLIVPNAEGPMHFKRSGSKIVDDEPAKRKSSSKHGNDCACSKCTPSGHLSDKQIAGGSY